jgi:hypothetical protein
VLGRFEGPAGLLHSELLDLDQELGLVDLVVAGLREIDPLGGLLDPVAGRLQGAQSDVDLGPRGHRLGQLGLVEVDLRLGRVAGSRHLLRPAQGHGLLPVEVRVAIVILPGQDHVGLRRLQAGAGLVDPFFHLVPGQLQRLVGLGLIHHRGGQRAPGDLDLDRDLALDPHVGGLLPAQVLPGRVELGLGQADLVAIRGRVDLRHHLARLDPVVLLDQEANDPPRDQRRGEVDDMGLHEGIVGD